MKPRTSTVLLCAIAIAAFMCASATLFAQSPYFPNFSSIANIAPNGSTAQAGSVLRLTPATTFKAGSAWFNVKQPVAGGFTAIFQFRISSSDAPNFPADGLAFVIQNSAAGTGALGPVGSGIGYGSNPDTPKGVGISNSLAVEFDTYQNTDDPNANHVSVQNCGTGPNSSDEGATFDDGTPCNLGTNSSLPVNLSDGKAHTVTIEYTPPCGECSVGTLDVTLDGTDLFPDGISVNLATRLSLDNGTAWAGFTGATGAAVENNDILSWTYTPHTSTSITQTLEPGVQSIYNFGSYNYKLTPDPSTNKGGDVVTITAVPIDPGAFDPGPNFPGAQCIVYANTGGKCIEFHATCVSGPDCTTGTYPLETNYDVPPGPAVLNPGLLDAPGEGCPPSPNPFTKNIITTFSQTRDDPVTKGSGGPGYNCFVAVQNVTYTPADVSLGKFANSSVASGSNLTYGLAAINFGPGTAQGVVISDTLPPGTTFVSAVYAKVACTLSSCGLPPPGSKSCTFDSGTNTVSCPTAQLAPSSLTSLTALGVKLVVKVTAPSGSVINNTATVTTISTDPNPANNSHTASTKVQ